MRDGYSVEDYNVIQSYDSIEGYWETRVTKNGHFVKRFYTFTGWGGMRKANRLIKKRTQ